MGGNRQDCTREAYCRICVESSSYSENRLGIKWPADVNVSLVGHGQVQKTSREKGHKIEQALQNETLYPERVHQFCFWHVGPQNTEVEKTKKQFLHLKLYN